MNIRYLNYSSTSYISLTLLHPQCLVSATLIKVKITNFSQCINLQNLYSFYNFYSPEDICPLTNLKRICFYNDVYQSSESCMLQDILKKNKLEYVDAAMNKNGNIVARMTLSQNTERLRFFKVIVDNERVDITLDVAQEFPASLVVYNITY